MAGSTYFPRTDEGLLGWALNFSSVISTEFESLGLTADDAAAFEGVKTDFASAMAANEPGVRNRVSVAAKNEARDAMKTIARSLVMRIQGTPSVTDAQKYELRITVRSASSPLPTPTTAPVATVRNVTGRTVRMTLADPANLTRRRRPIGVRNANVFWCSGAELAAPGDRWIFGGARTNTTFDLVLDGASSEATAVWICAMWVGTRGELSPTSPPLRVELSAVQATPMQWNVAA